MDVTEHPVKVNPKRQRIVAYVVLALAMGFGLWRVEDTADDAKRTADAFQAAEDREELDEIRDAERICATRNTAIRDGRQRLDALLNGVEQILNQENPDETVKNSAIVNQLRLAVSVSSDEEDRDCNIDGVVDEEDYSS